MRIEQAQPLWSRSWYFDFVSRDGSAGGFVRVGEYPHLGQTWWWAYVVGQDRKVAGAALELPGSLPGSLADDAPFRLDDSALRMSVGPGPDEDWHLTAAGDGFALNIRWSATAPPHEYGRGNRYEQPGWARGAVTVGGDTLAVDGPGQRDHSWGVRDWWRLGWHWCAGWLDDGERFQATRLEARGRIAPDGYLLPLGGKARPVLLAEVDTGAETQAGTRITLDGRWFVFEDLAAVPLTLTAPDGRHSILTRSMAAVRGPDGRTGFGWREHNVPAVRNRPSK
ncbi:hypothetical protein ABIA31_006248 [Catenulispora sp. MAP5-51]|uniref:DUF7064 domain-containing protein n=1 Tax=Catenulispora sp. MAP5-51 TaxID=3156298 RepID=UPI003513EF6F